MSQSQTSATMKVGTKPRFEKNKSSLLGLENDTKQRKLQANNIYQVHDYLISSIVQNENGRKRDANFLVAMIIMMILITPVNILHIRSSVE